MESSFIGDWKLVSNEHLGKLMKKLDIKQIVRKAVKATKPKLRFEKKSDLEWTIRLLLPPFKLHKFKFKLGERIVDDTPDGKKMLEMRFDVEKNQMTIINYDLKDPNRVLCVATLDITSDGHLRIVFVADDVVATQIYKKAKLDNQKMNG